MDLQNFCAERGFIACFLSLKISGQAKLDEVIIFKREHRVIGRHIAYELRFKGQGSHFAEATLGLNPHRPALMIEVCQDTGEH